MIAPDASHRKIDCGYIDKHVFAVLAQLTELIVGKLAIIVRGILPGSENIHDLLRMKRHHRLEHHAINERENGRVNSDCERERQYRDGGESRRLHQLSGGKFEILDHQNLALFSLRCGGRGFRIQNFRAAPETATTDGGRLQRPASFLVW